MILTGMGKSGLVCRKIAATLSSTGTPAFFLHPAEGAHGDLGVLSHGDVVLAVSNSGETTEILGLLPLVRRKTRTAPHRGDRRRNVPLWPAGPTSY